MKKWLPCAGKPDTVLEAPGRRRAEGRGLAPVHPRFRVVVAGAGEDMPSNTPVSAIATAVDTTGIRGGRVGRSRGAGYAG